MPPPDSTTNKPVIAGGIDGSISGDVRIVTWIRPVCNGECRKATGQAADGCTGSTVVDD
jgi:hypothetical protein